MELCKTNHNTKKSYGHKTDMVRSNGFCMAVKEYKKKGLDLDLVNSSKNGASLVAQLVKNPPVMQDTQVGSLGQEDPLEKGMITHSSLLAWRILQTE